MTAPASNTTAKREARRRAAFVDRILEALCTSCSRCEFDEAEGLVVNHCNACCRKIVGKVWKTTVEEAERK